MPWRLEPLIWPILIATLALLAIPRAHGGEPPPDLIAACQGDVMRFCLRAAMSQDKDAIDRCMRAHRKQATPQCQKAAERHGL